MPADFGYINARVRGLKAQLLAPEFYTDALGASDFRAFLNALSQTPYGRELEEAQARYGGGLGAVDEALGRSFYSTTRTLLSVADGLPERLLKLLLLRYDLHNLKAIARAKHAEREAEDVTGALMPAGALKPAVLENIAAAPDLSAAAQALAITGHPLGRAFSQASARYASEGDLYAFELALDRAYFEVLIAEAASGDFPADFVRYVQREIDATNIRTALKVQGTGEVSADELFVRGGKEVRRATFESLLAGDTQALANTSFAAVAEAGGLTEAEEILRGALESAARKLYLRDPLGVGVVLHYLRLRETEAAKLRLLARGKFYGVPRAQLEQELGSA
ncbi:V-type ATPase subunit [Truepera radiovictrix]|uniref:V-type ATP synthase subunit C n=1 Tax=Truepera radiovictrix (strain DSM 17093 / CIP 108686 / LMG 22925 / RQ-24) TaxID=649638 RepID=D7CR00_TRURR|nr:V-type ATPase subunit [Truepera radiovictrix]ADI15134.1 H+transporting two-sector ATPase C (AC39) subunit [Truepera radiovictrix DSM 17093]WMT56313.1 V-type ATPase subunit [Truepera radiovictrix]